MPGMFKDNVSLNNPIVVALFRHDVYVSSVYWIIAIALALLLGATEDDPQYEIASDKTDHVAMHKGSALTKIEE